MKATRKSWTHWRFGYGRRFAYGRAFTAQETTRLELGIIPEEMEHKWFIYFDEPYLYLHRSWSGLPVWRVRLQRTETGMTAVEACASSLAKQDGKFDPGAEVEDLDSYRRAKVSTHDRSWRPAGILFCLRAAAPPPPRADTVSRKSELSLAGISHRSDRVLPDTNTMGV